MSHEEADLGFANPHYSGRYDDPYSVNCQSCVVAYELRRRGLDVAAMPNFGIGTTSSVLSHYTFLAWEDPITGRNRLPKNIAAPTKKRRYSDEKIVRQLSTPEIKYKALQEATLETGRYHVSLNWKKTDGGGGHIFCVERKTTGELKVFDAQTGQNWTDELLKGYLKKASSYHGLDVLKVDDLVAELNLVSKVITAQNTPRYTNITDAKTAKAGILGILQEGNTSNFKALKKAVVRKAKIIKEESYPNLKTGLFYQTKTSFKRGINHTINKEEVDALSEINEHIGDFHFIRESKLGEVKDLSKTTDIANINRKIKRGVTSYNIYKWEYNGNTWIVKTEVYKNYSETIYTLYKKK